MKYYINDNLEIRLDNFYRQKVLPYISTVRGTTRIAWTTRKLALKSLSREEGENYEFAGKGLDFKVANRETFAAAVTERDFVNIYLEELQKLDEEGVILDLGSFYGFYSLMAGILGFKVKAFEPDQMNYSNLVENVELNKFSIETNRKAVLDQNRTVKMTSTANVKNTVGKGQEEVEAVSIDNFIDSEEIKLVKIDVEGAELKALRGMRNTLIDQKPVLLIELHKEDTKEPFKHDPEEVKDFLRDLDYTLQTVEKRRKQELLVARYGGT